MKKTLALLLTLAMLLPMITVIAPLGASAAPEAIYDKPSHTAASDGSVGFTVDDSDGDSSADDFYFTRKKLERIPVTYQAWVYIPADYSTRLVSSRNDLGVIVSNSNYVNDTHGAQLDFYITKDRSPAICYVDNMTTTYDVRFDKSAVPVEQWTMVTVVWDGESGYVSCYLNGELTEQEGFLPAIDSHVTDMPIAIGVSYGSLYKAKAEQKHLLYGVQDISLYATARTAEQIKAAYENGVKLNDTELICHYDLDASDKHTDFTDATGNGYAVQYSKKWLTEQDMEKIRAGYAFEPAFSFAAIGDTQKTMYREGFTNGYRVNASKQITTNSGTPTKSIIYNMYKWMADNKDAKNLQVVMGLGDITDANLSVEWEIAAASTRQMGAAGLPYVMMRGNHDSYTNTHSNSYGSYKGIGDTSIDTYYGKNATIDEYYYSQYTDPAKGGMYNNSVRNVYRLIDAGDTKWMIITLDFRADDNVLKWAGKLCESYADRNVIITTHIYQDYEGNPISFGGLSDSPNNGDDKWNELASKHENIKMVLSGHIGSEVISLSQVKGDAGNTVTQMMIDPQNFDGSAGGLGLVAMFYFNEDGTEFYTEFYSVEKNAYLLNYNQFYVDLEADGVEQVATQLDVYAGKKPVGSGTQADPYRISSLENFIWISYTVNRNDSAVQFKNTYFVQTCDIDLQGLTLRSIGGYFKNASGSGLQAKAFGGHYDGCGFSIKNGTFSAAQPDTYFNKRKQNGLFGCIYGATIQNVVLEDVVIAGRGPTGAIVGKAMAPWDGSGKVGFNKIIGCHVEEDVELRTWHPNMVTDDVYDSETRAGVVGGICGIAYATEIRGCTVENTIAVTGYFGIVGGIAGTAGYNTVIDHCAFQGGIELVDTVTYRSNSIGGIVGMISPMDGTKADQDQSTPMAGILHITNCYNGGTYEYTGNVELGTVDPENGYNVNRKNVHFGGIIGHAGGLLEVAPTAEAPYPFLIENCYNLHNEQRNAYEQNTERYYVGGLIGRSYALNKSSSVLYFKNCYSVKVDGAGGPIVKGDGTTVYATYTNEYWYETQASALSSEGKVVIQVLDNSVGTKTVDEMNMDLRAIDVEIARIQGLSSDVANTWSVGEGAPKKHANPGDMYLDALTGDVWQYAKDWELIANIKGVQGEQGAQGEKGEQGEQGESGPQGEKGERGEVGPQGEKGEQGEVGPQGPQGADGAAGSVTNRITIDPETGNWVVDDIDTGIKAQGPVGEQGEQGEKGDRGQWYVGTAAPATISGAVSGDLYLDATTGDMYRYNGALWQVIGNLQGPEGEQGKTGSAGAGGNKWYTGTTAPQSGMKAASGDMYMNTKTGDVYEYSGSIWQKIGNLKGPKGENGASADLTGTVNSGAAPQNGTAMVAEESSVWSVVALIIAAVALLGNAVFLVFYIRGKNKRATW